MATADYTTKNPNLYFSGGIKSLPMMDQVGFTDQRINDDGHIYSNIGKNIDSKYLVDQTAITRLSQITGNYA